MKKNLHLTLGIALLFSFLFSNLEANAQLSRMMNQVSKAKNSGNGVGGKAYKTFSIGYGVSFFGLDFSHEFSEFSNGQLRSQPAITNQYRIRALNIESNTYIWLTDLDEKTNISLHLGGRGQVYEYMPEEYDINENSSYHFSLLGQHIGIPIGLEIAHGGMASLNKRDKTSVALGFGVQPTIYSTHFGMDKYITYDIRPYAKFTAGFYAGIQWNFFMTYLSGSTNVLNFRPDADATFQTSVPGVNSYVNMKQGGVFSIGIAVLPLSFLWEDRF